VDTRSSSQPRPPRYLPVNDGGVDRYSMGERDAARAVELVRALCEVLDKMTGQLTWVEQRGARLEAAALRQDIHEADAHIERLERRYLELTGTERRHA
jgi:hypothetical protein